MEEMLNDSIDKYAGDKELRSELQGRFRKASEFYKDWVEVAKEDYRFSLGDQWKKEDRDALEAQSRPVLTFNRIRPILNAITGYERENSSRIKVSPEGGEDKIFSEVMDRGIKHIDKVAHLSFKEGYWFDEGCSTGKSFMEASIQYDRDPVRGELSFELLTPYQVLPDPDFKGYDLNEGCAYCFKVGRFTKRELIKLFPDKKKLIEGFKTDTDNVDDNLDIETIEGVTDDYGNKNTISDGGKVTAQSAPTAGDDVEQDEKFTIKEYWRQKDVKKYFVIEAESGEPRRFDTQEEAQAFAAQQGAGIKVITRDVPEMWVADQVCGMILQDVKSPFEPHYSGYPFFRFMAEWAPNAESEVLRTQSIVRQLKDPQREKNKAKSQNLHILNTQANSGWIGDKDALTPTGWEDLKKMGSKPGIVIQKQSKDAELREILPKGPNAGHIQREEKADEEFTRIGGVDPTLWGNTPEDLSGRAMAMRIKQGLKALARLFSNFQYSKEILGNFILAMFPLIFNDKKMAKIVGPKYMNETRNEQYPDGISLGVLQAFLTMIADDKYDLLVTEADAQSSIRYETFQGLIEALKAGAQIPPTLLVDYMDIPNSDEVKKQMEAMQQAQLAAQSQRGAAA